ncbi:hypothetical protein [Streptomyces sp. BP-8]|uniref:Uncharacterized protein n=1 Tax=Streptomyces sirii TaxID=3127701 RepID=A0ABZ2QQ30_9ACTN
MAERIVRIFEPLLRLLFPAPDRHRAAEECVSVRHGEASTNTLRRVPVRGPELLRGEDTALLRPYVLTPEERRERRLERASQCGRRRALWLAVSGMDAGSRWIHGVEVAGR